MEAATRAVHVVELRAPQQLTWQDLRDRFLSALAEPDAEPSKRWLEIWQLVVSHPWYQQQLASAARSVLRGSGVSLQLQKDIEHDSMTLLARRLRKSAGLGIDPVRAERHFAGWMRTIISRDCRDAVRKLRRQSAASLQRPDHLPASEERVQRETRIDLAMALDRLGGQERAVLTLYSAGYTLLQIAEKLGLTFWETHGAFHRALKRVRRLLGLPRQRAS